MKSPYSFLHIQLLKIIVLYERNAQISGRDFLVSPQYIQETSELLLCLRYSRLIHFL